MADGVEMADRQWMLCMTSTVLPEAPVWEKEKFLSQARPFVEPSDFVLLHSPKRERTKVIEP